MPKSYIGVTTPHETVLIVWVSTVGDEHANGSRLWLSLAMNMGPS